MSGEKGKSSALNLIDEVSSVLNNLKQKIETGSGAEDDVKLDPEILNLAQKLRGTLDTLQKNDDTTQESNLSDTCDSLDEDGSICSEGYEGSEDSVSEATPLVKNRSSASIFSDNKSSTIRQSKSSSKNHVDSESSQCEDIDKNIFGRKEARSKLTCAIIRCKSREDEVHNAANTPPIIADESIKENTAPVKSSTKRNLPWKIKALKKRKELNSTKAAAFSKSTEALHFEEQAQANLLKHSKSAGSVSEAAYKNVNFTPFQTSPSPQNVNIDQNVSINGSNKIEELTSPRINGSIKLSMKEESYTIPIASNNLSSNKDRKLSDEMNAMANKHMSLVQSSDKTVKSKHFPVGTHNKELSKFSEVFSQQSSEKPLEKAPRKKIVEQARFMNQSSFIKDNILPADKTEIHVPSKKKFSIDPTIKTSVPNIVPKKYVKPEPDKTDSSELPNTNKNNIFTPTFSKTLVLSTSNNKNTSIIPENNTFNNTIPVTAINKSISIENNNSIVSPNKNINKPLIKQDSLIKEDTITNGTPVPSNKVKISPNVINISPIGDKKPELSQDKINNEHKNNNLASEVKCSTSLTDYQKSMPINETNYKVSKSKSSPSLLQNKKVGVNQNWINDDQSVPGNVYKPCFIKNTGVKTNMVNDIQKKLNEFSKLTEETPKETPSNKKTKKFNRHSSLINTEDILAQKAEQSSLKVEGNMTSDPSSLLFTPEQLVKIAVHKAAINKQLNVPDSQDDPSTSNQVEVITSSLQVTPGGKVEMQDRKSSIHADELNFQLENELDSDSELISADYYSAEDKDFSEGQLFLSQDESKILFSPPSPLLHKESDIKNIPQIDSQIIFSNTSADSLSVESPNIRPVIIKKPNNIRPSNSFPKSFNLSKNEMPLSHENQDVPASAPAELVSISSSFNKSSKVSSMPSSEISILDDQVTSDINTNKNNVNDYNSVQKSPFETNKKVFSPAKLRPMEQSESSISIDSSENNQKSPSQKPAVYNEKLVLKIPINNADQETQCKPNMKTDQRAKGTLSKWKSLENTSKASSLFQVPDLAALTVQTNKTSATIDTSPFTSGTVSPLSSVVPSKQLNTFVSVGVSANFQAQRVQKQSHSLPSSPCFGPKPHFDQNKAENQKENKSNKVINVWMKAAETSENTTTLKPWAKNERNIKGQYVKKNKEKLLCNSTDDAVSPTPIEKYPDKINKQLNKFNNLKTHKEKQLNQKLSAATVNKTSNSESILQNLEPSKPCAKSDKSSIKGENIENIEKKKEKFLKSNNETSDITVEKNIKENKTNKSEKIKSPKTKKKKDMENKIISNSSKNIDKFEKLAGDIENSKETNDSKCVKSPHVVAEKIPSVKPQGHVNLINKSISTGNISKTIVSHEILQKEVDTSSNSNVVNAKISFAITNDNVEKKIANFIQANFEKDKSPGNKENKIIGKVASGSDTVKKVSSKFLNNESPEQIESQNKGRLSPRVNKLKTTSEAFQNILNKAAEDNTIKIPSKSKESSYLSGTGKAQSQINLFNKSASLKSPVSLFSSQNFPRDSEKKIKRSSSSSAIKNVIFKYEEGNTSSNKAENFNSQNDYSNKPVIIDSNKGSIKGIISNFEKSDNISPTPAPTKPSFTNTNKFSNNSASDSFPRTNVLYSPPAYNFSSDSRVSNQIHSDIAMRTAKFQSSNCHKEAKTEDNFPLRMSKSFTLKSSDSIFKIYDPEPTPEVSKKTLDIDTQSVDVSSMIKSLEKPVKRSTHYGKMRSNSERAKERPKTMHILCEDLQDASYDYSAVRKSWLNEKDSASYKQKEKEAAEEKKKTIAQFFSQDSSISLSKSPQDKLFTASSFESYKKSPDKPVYNPVQAPERPAYKPIQPPERPSFKPFQAPDKNWSFTPEQYSYQSNSKQLDAAARRQRFRTMPTSQKSSLTDSFEHLLSGTEFNDHQVDQLFKETILNDMELSDSSRRFSDFSTGSVESVCESIGKLSRSQTLSKFPDFGNLSSSRPTSKSIDKLHSLSEGYKSFEKKTSFISNKFDAQKYFSGGTSGSGKQNINIGSSTSKTSVHKVNAPIFTFSAGGVTRSASGVKDMILSWCQRCTRSYQGVKIDNFSTSWNDGMAFCALIHNFYPDAFDFSSLTPKNKRYNFQLAFKVADERAEVFPLLDVEDMVMMQKPDWKCVFTYVQALYKVLKDL